MLTPQRTSAEAYAALRLKRELAHYAYLATRRETRNVEADRKRQRIANVSDTERRRAQWRAATNKRRGK